MRFSILFAIFFFLAACGREEAPLLAVHQILNKTGAALKERLGEPDFDFVRSEKVTTLQWRDADGDSTWVYVDLIHDNASYVTYTFKKMDPFDTAEALRRIGLSVPEQAGTSLGKRLKALEALRPIPPSGGQSSYQTRHCKPRLRVGRTTRNS